VAEVALTPVDGSVVDDVAVSPELVVPELAPAPSEPLMPAEAPVEPSVEPAVALDGLGVVMLPAAPEVVSWVGALVVDWAWAAPASNPQAATAPNR
jgi:hypothetical protein